MMRVDEAEFDESGHVIALKGHAKPKKRFKRVEPVFSAHTHKVMKWSELRLDYAGG